MSEFFSQKLPLWQRWAVVMLLAITLSIFCAFQESIPNEDGIYYLSVAKLIQAGKWSEALEYRDFPFFATLIVGVHFFIPDWFLAGRILSIVSILLAIIPLYAAMRKLYGEDNAWISACFLSVMPSLRFISVNIFRETIFLFFFSCFLFCYVNILLQEEKKRLYLWHIGSIFTLFLVGLCRVEGYLVLGVYIVLLFGKMLLSSKPWVKKVSIVCVFCILTWSIIEFMTPYGILLQTPRFHFIRIFFQHNQEWGKTIKYIQVYNTLKGWEEMLPGRGNTGNVLEITRRYLPLIYTLGIVDAFLVVAFPTTFFLGILGMWKQLRQSIIDRKIFLWFVFLLLPAYAFLMLENHMSKRYLYASTILFYFWVGVGFTTVWAWLQKRWQLSNRYQVILLVVLLGISVGRVIGKNEESGLAIAQAGTWLKENSPDNLIVSNDCRIVFYADKPCEHMNITRWPPIPIKDCNDPREYLAMSENFQAKYIALWRKKHDPELGEPVQVFKGDSKTVFIYKVPEKK